MRVSVVGTYHAERGQTSVAALQAMLERVQPDVIFVEVPPAYGDRYKDGSHGTLESVAVARYLATRRVSIVPVDLAEPEQSFFDDTEDMVRAVERTSPEYRRLIDVNTANVAAGGFPYLNSDRCMQAWTEIYREELATIEWLRAARLRAIYDLWIHMNECRDREMIKNIIEYCSRNHVSNGMLLVGAAHRKSLIEKASAMGGTGSTRIEWDLSGFLGDAG
jgi:hypothetical protein